MLTEQNFRVMIALVILVLIVGVWLPLKFWQWTALVIASVVMLAVELVNTAIEKAMDLVLPASLEEIKVIKHIMAGAAFVAAGRRLAAGGVGFFNIFFLPCKKYLVT